MKSFSVNIMTEVLQLKGFFPEYPICDTPYMRTKEQSHYETCNHIQCRMQRAFFCRINTLYITFLTRISHNNNMIFVLASTRSWTQNIYKTLPYSPIALLRACPVSPTALLPLFKILWPTTLVEAACFLRGQANTETQEVY